MKKYLLGADLGTTQVKAGLFTEEGVMVESASQGNYQIISQHPNWAEQDAIVWWNDTRDVIRKMVTAAGGGQNIGGVSISSQGMTMLPLDALGNPLSNAHIWMDRRATEESAILADKLGQEFIKTHLGAYMDPYYQVTNVLWFKRHQPELYEKTAHIVKANTFLNYRLTGEFAIDETQAVMSLGFDILRKEWSKELEEAMEVPISRLFPPVKPPESILGTVTSAAAEETGLLRGTPVFVSSVDTALAMLEIGIAHSGDACEITGTSSNDLFVSSRMPDSDSPILYFRPLIESSEVPVMLFAPTNTTGEALRWTRNILGITGSQAKDGRNIYNVIDEMIKNSHCGSGGMFFYPYLLGERAPLWSNTVRGMFIGASIATTQGDMLRSVYEGTSYALKEICSEAIKAGASIDHFRIAGGCAKSDIWTKIKASVLGMPIEVVADKGGAPRGNAILAAYGLGLYSDFSEAVSRLYSCERVIEPDPEWMKQYEELYPVFLSMRDSLLTDLEKLAVVTAKYE